MHKNGHSIWKLATRRHDPLDIYGLSLKESIYSLGIYHEGAINLANYLDAHGGLSGFLQMPLKALEGINGIGKAAARRLKALQIILIADGMFTAAELQAALGLRSDIASLLFGVLMSEGGGDIKRLHELGDLESFRLANFISSYEMARVVLLQSLLDMARQPAQSGAIAGSSSLNIG